MVSNLGFVGVDALPEHFVAAAGGSGAHIDPLAHAAVRNQGWFNPPHFFLLVQKETGWSLKERHAKGGDCHITPFGNPRFGTGVQ